MQYKFQTKLLSSWHLRLSLPLDAFSSKTKNENSSERLLKANQLIANAFAGYKIRLFSIDESSMVQLLTSLGRSSGRLLKTLCSPASPVGSRVPEHASVTLTACPVQCARTELS